MLANPTMTTLNFAKWKLNKVKKLVKFDWAAIKDKMLAGAKLEKLLLWTFWLQLVCRWIEHEGQFVRKQLPGEGGWNGLRAIIFSHYWYLLKSVKKNTSCLRLLKMDFDLSWNLWINGKLLVWCSISLHLRNEEVSLKMCQLQHPAV